MTKKQFEIIVELLQKIYTELNNQDKLKNRRPVRAKKF